MGSFWCGDFFEKLKKSQITPKVNKLNVDDKTLVCCVVLSPVPLLEPGLGMIVLRLLKKRSKMIEPFQVI